jgi:hypothetical protein
VRTNSCGVTEKAEFKIDLDKFASEIVRIFGEKKSEFCEYCEKRFVWCECDVELKDKEECSDCGGKGEWLECGVIISCAWCDSTGHIIKEKE